MNVRLSAHEIKTLLFAIFVITIGYIRYVVFVNMAYYFLLAEMAVILLSILLCGYEKRRINGILWLLIGFMVYREITSYYWRGEVVGEAKKVIFFEIGIFVVCLFLLTSSTRNSVFRLIRDAGVINGLVGTVEFITKNNNIIRNVNHKNYSFSTLLLNTNNWRVRTFFWHPTICALFTIVSWVVLLYNPIKNRAFDYIVKVLMIVTLIGTKSRNGWITFLIVNAICIGIKWAKKRNYTNRNSLYYLIGATVALFIGLIVLGERTRTVFNMVWSRWLTGFNRLDEGNYNRVTMLRLGINEWKNSTLSHKLFGYGADYAISLLRAHPIRGWNNAVDNTYLTVLLNYGAIGVGFIFLLVIFSLRNALKTKDVISEMSALIVVSIFISCFFFDMFSWLTCVVCLIISVFGETIQKDERTSSG